MHVDTPAIKGWYVGKIVSSVHSMRDINKKNPSVNLVINYSKRVTKNENLYGRVASSLNVQRYGPEELWTLLAEKNSAFRYYLLDIANTHIICAICLRIREGPDKYYFADTGE